MNTKNYLRFGVPAVALCSASLAFGATATIDDFDTFSGSVGWSLTSSVPGNQTDGGLPGDAVPGSDTSFIGLLSRKAQLTTVSGSGSTFNNNSPASSANWSKPTSSSFTGSVNLPYSFSLAQDLSAYTQFDLSFLAPTTGGGTLDILVTALSGSFSLTGAPVASGASTPSFVVASMSGYNIGIWQSVKTIKFTLNNSSEGTSVMQIGDIGLFGRDAQVPEAKTMVPVIAFVGAAGLMAWRRRAAK